MAHGRLHTRLRAGTQTTTLHRLVVDDETQTNTVGTTLESTGHGRSALAASDLINLQPVQFGFGDGIQNQQANSKTQQRGRRYCLGSAAESTNQSGHTQGRQTGRTLGQDGAKGIERFKGSLENQTKGGILVRGKSTHGPFCRHQGGLAGATGTSQGIRSSGEGWWWWWRQGNPKTGVAGTRRRGGGQDEKESQNGFAPQEKGEPGTIGQTRTQQGTATIVARGFAKGVGRTRAAHEKDSRIKSQEAIRSTINIIVVVAAIAQETQGALEGWVEHLFHDAQARQVGTSFCSPQGGRGVVFLVISSYDDCGEQQ
mmetsp:Transcript_6579/g.18404  ORF Transcript_6579/g.18404 Transcript_6579/m.18404 type:complete len:313 (+) Transcript_6579:905-1843(+)